MDPGKTRTAAGKGTRERWGDREKAREGNGRESVRESDGEREGRRRAKRRQGKTRRREGNAITEGMHCRGCTCQYTYT